ncbi:ABC transporter permease [Thermoanaerobacterium sp. RBIITD]|uniref:ABC transporter permease n=1 Tax=Thermoanaerobacterium sp. RBIITD TaxID=1550240 RepID=UPI000BBFC7CA|nr:ABC transporter permease [Thermoanaerobacterium sp. RBIITD]SNX54278.1 NitT/TauT family transport system permease protein [Thermoanaerobacterium sp. RBIITD]
MYSDDIKAEPITFMMKLGKAFNPKAALKQRNYFIIGCSSFVIFFILWSILSYSGLVPKIFLPTPTETIQAAIRLFTEFNFIHDIGITIFRVLMGFLISALIAIPLGILIGTYKPIEAFLEPLMSFVRYLPASAFIPLFILWIGVNEVQKIAIIFIGSFPQLVLMISTTIRNVREDLLDVAYTLGTSQSSVLWRIILPSSLPAIIDSLRLILGWAWTYIIVAELVGASSGIGYVIINAQRMLRTSEIFVGIVVIGLIGLLFDYFFKYLYNRLFPWI